MDKTVGALKMLYQALGGLYENVETITTIPGMIIAISILIATGKETDGTDEDELDPTSK